MIPLQGGTSNYHPISGLGRHAMAYENHWLPGFNFNVEEWFEGDHYETLAICRQLALARASFKEAIAENEEAIAKLRR